MDKVTWLHTPSPAGKKGFPLDFPEIFLYRNIWNSSSWECKNLLARLQRVFENQEFPLPAFNCAILRITKGDGVYSVTAKIKKNHQSLLDFFSRATMLTVGESCTMSSPAELHNGHDLTLFWAEEAAHLAAGSHIRSVGAWRRVKVPCQVLHHCNKHVLISTGAGKQTLSEVPRWQ